MLLFGKVLSSSPFLPGLVDLLWCLLQEFACSYDKFAAFYFSSSRLLSGFVD